MTDRIIIKPEAFAESAKKAAQVRHIIHRRPEIGLNLTETEKTIVEALKSFGCEEVYTRVGGSEVSGVVCVIKGDEPGRTIGLRADSDALPLNENTGAAYSSEKPKHMHACGHDGHVATLLAVVQYFMQHRHFAGTLVAIFQPGEEGFAGARHMVLLSALVLMNFMHCTQNPRLKSVASVLSRGTVPPMRISLRFNLKVRAVMVHAPNWLMT